MPLYNALPQQLFFQTCSNISYSYEHHSRTSSPTVVKAAHADKVTDREPDKFQNSVVVVFSFPHHVTSKQKAPQRCRPLGISPGNPASTDCLCDWSMKVISWLRNVSPYTNLWPYLLLNRFWLCLQTNIYLYIYCIHPIVDSLWEVVHRKRSLVLYSLPEESTHLEMFEDWTEFFSLKDQNDVKVQSWYRVKLENHL